MKDKTKNPTEILAGSRLKIFKETNLFSWQEIADKTGFSLDSLKHWPHDGIDEKKVAGIAKKLGFESWVFTNEELDDESVKQIFLYPERQSEYMPTKKNNEIKYISEESNSIKDIDVNEEQDSIEDNKPDSKEEENTPEENDVIDNPPPTKGILSSDFDKISAILKSTAKIYDNFWEPQK